MPFIWFHFPISSVTCLHFVVSTAVENYCQLLFWHEVARELFYNQFTRYYTFRPLGRPACARSGVALDTLTSSGTRISWRITFSCIGTCVYTVYSHKTVLTCWINEIPGDYEAQCVRHTAHHVYTHENVPWGLMSCGGSFSKRTRPSGGQSE